MKELNIRKVAGMTAAGWMIIIAVVLFFSYLAIKIIPAYVENGNVVSLMKSTADLGISQESNKEILKKFQTKIGFARMTKLLNKDNYRIEQEATGKYLIVDYDKKLSMFGNISVLIEFEHKQKL
ncbi:DUF4845 domain-containing protein [Kangiella sp. HZ709]|uniref:DUF4845 domain-containing protein n=1 Tax=Kangiella sp. HZ709 TaxID=2666328 RepID=UPI0012AFC2AF|nr:DUF4845 domain-containing protein [Kangiella sp. HZ709]MRX27347.1 DUF4845 domain-containing protein [Kangiella sp. HZ709]